MNMHIFMNIFGKVVGRTTATSGCNLLSDAVLFRILGRSLVHLVFARWRM